MPSFQRSSAMGGATRPISLRLAPCHIEQLKARAFTVSGNAHRRRPQADSDGPGRAADADRTPARGAGSTLLATDMMLEMMT